MVSVCKPFHFRLLCVLFLLLLDLNQKLPSAAVVPATEPTACVGTRRSEFSMSNPVKLVEILRKSLAGCQFVIGDIHIIKINEQEFIDKGVTFDLSFLNSIREVTGCIQIIDSCFSKPISFKNLEVIRGQCNDNAIAMHFMATCKMDIPPVDFRSLRYIGQGGIRIGGLKSCYLEKRVNFTELFSDTEKQNFRIDLPCTGDKKPLCHASCPEWPDSNKYCWGPEPDQCQVRSKCRSNRECVSNRCFLSNGVEHCCPDNCLGGCFGSSSRQCYGCAMFNKNGTCVDACRYSSKVYDTVSARYIKSQEKLYPLGPICVSKCPSSFFVEEDACVSKCTTGYSANSNRTCVKMQAIRHCDAVESAILCSDNNALISPLKNSSVLPCTEFTGDISILDTCFDGKNTEGQKRLSIEDLNFIFSRLTVVRGSIFVTIKKPLLRNLSFMSSLKKIESALGNSDSGNLLIISPYIQYLGLSSLQNIAGSINILASTDKELTKLKDTSVQFCPNLFPKTKASTDGVIVTNQLRNTRTGNFFRKIQNGFFQKMCPAELDKCHEECDSSYGCWGPLANHCVKCSRAKAGQHCISDCSSASGWFNHSLTTSISSTQPILENHCSRCSVLCSKCFGPNDDDCTDCVPAAFRDETKCVRECSIRTQYSDSNRICRNCSKLCLNQKNNIPTCSGNGSFVGHGGCQFCARVLPELDKTGVRILTCLNAREPCPDGFYVAVLDQSHVVDFPEILQILKSTTLSVSICLRCADQCKKCRGAPGICTECKYFSVELKKDLERSQIQCTSGSECPGGYFLVEQEKICKPCAQHCSKCSGPTDSECYKCDDRVYTYFPDGINSTNTRFTCVSSCPDTQPHAVSFENLGMTCSSNPTNSVEERERHKAAKITAFQIGFAVFVVLLLFSCIVVSCYWFRQRSRNSRKKSRIIGVWDEDMEPLNVTNTVPNVAVLRTISEKEISRGQEVGSGAFGTVFRGEWFPDGENKKISVAIKILSDSIGDSNVSSELLEESRIMASVEHPHCVRLVGICMAQPLQLITQFMPLGNLRDFLRARKDTDQIGSSHLLRYASQIASGMGYLEQRNIIHRDLACRNVLVASAKCVKITDFGLAKVLDNPNDEYKASGGKLPVKWLALECLVSRKFSHKSDVWAYGVTLWEIFMFGDPPYVNVKPADLADYLEKGERLPQPPICTLDVYILMIKCWMLNESQRPTFDELEATFKKMAHDPGRYVYIKGDKYARNPSNESASTEHRSESSKSPSVNHISASERLASAEVDDCNYSALDTTDMENDVFRGDLSLLLVPGTSTSQPSASNNSADESSEAIAADASAVAAGASASASRSSSRQPRTHPRGSQMYVNVKKPRPSSNNDNKYTSDPCKVTADEHLSPTDESSSGNADHDYLPPIRADSNASQDATSQTRPPNSLPPCTTVQNPEYFFNASRRQYHNIVEQSPTAQVGVETDDAFLPLPPPPPPPLPSPPPALPHPLQLWVAAARTSRSNSSMDEDTNLSYV